jgi:anti-sigma factor RsiW
MSISSQAHVSDDELEQYLLGSLPEPDVNEVEYHLLVCPPCQDLLEETEQYLATMKIATAQGCPAQSGSPSGRDGCNSSSRCPSRRWQQPACALFAFILLVPRNSQTATLELESLRGPESAVQAPSNAKLTLRLSLVGIARVAGPLAVQIADAGGSIVARSSPEIEGSRAVSHVDALRPGIYWVRLHDKGELVREFGLSVH